MSAGNYLIGDIENYDDWAEWQYDWRMNENKWYYRPLSGSWNESRLSITPFKELNKDTID